MNFIRLYQLKQLPNLPQEKNKLEEIDFKKLIKHLPKNKDIFGSECVIWSGCVCNKDKPKKGIYINWFHNEKKKTLHRLLYENFRDGNLYKKCYLENSCGNKLCVNVNHIIPKMDKHKIQEKEYQVQFKIDF